MHGQFFPHQHYLQQNRGSGGQNVTGSSRNLGDMGQQAHLAAQMGAQRAAVNGQAFQNQATQRVQQIPHYSGLSQQQYNQLLQGHNYQLYNTALHGQTPTIQRGQAQVSQQQQNLLSQQQNAADATLRSMLSSPYHQSALSSMQQQMASLNQLGLNPTSVHQQQVANNIHVVNSIQQIANNLQHNEHIQSTSSKTPVPHLTRILLNSGNEQQVRRQEVRTREPPSSNPRISAHVLAQPAVRTVHIQNPPAQRSSTPSMNSEVLLQRHISPSRLQNQYRQNASPNLFSSVLLSPELQGQGSVISPHRPQYSPSVGHLTHLNRLPSNALPMTRTEISTAPEQNIRGNNFGTNSNLVSPPAVQDHGTYNQPLQSPPIKVTTTGGVIQNEVYVKRQTASVNSCSAPVIISDSEDDDDFRQQPQGSSREMKKEEPESKGSPSKFTRIVIDDDIEIVGTKEAEVMSHMRSDCPKHSFRRIDSVSVGPQDENAARCSKCFCYVCDKPAHECSQWTNPNFPHCNAHSKASCWKARRNTKKSPFMLKLSADEVTPEITNAGDEALQYMIKIREAFITYRTGTPCEYNQVPCNCICHRSRGHDPCMQCKAVHDMKKKFNYEPVRKIAIGITEEIHAKFSGIQPLSALIMLEAVLSELCSHRPADFNHTTRMPSNPDTRCQCNTPQIIEQYIEKEMMDILTRNEISKTFRNYLVKCVEEAVKPLQLKDVMKRFLSMRHWDDLLLRAVLSGSNVTGSKSRDVLRETADVVKSRVEKLDKEKRYHSITRYLRAVKIYQTSKSSISHAEIVPLIEQWLLLYTAKQGHFKDIVLRLTEISNKGMGGMPTCYLAGLPVDFLIKLLDALAGKDLAPNACLNSFESKNPQSPYTISGKDADILLLLFEFILDQNKQASRHIPFYLWLAEWVNRTPLSQCVDPNMIRPWVEAGKLIIEQAHRALLQGQCQSLLIQCNTHGPHVHLFTASMNILHAVTTYRDLFQSSHIQAIMEAYKNNEWALFHLLSQSQLMNFGSSMIIRWVSNYARNNNGILAQFNDKVLIEAIQTQPLEDITELMKSIIKPDWTNSIEPIQRIVLSLSAEYSKRLLEELQKVSDPKCFYPASIWLEELILQKAFDDKIMASINRDPTSSMNLKTVAKVCSFVHPIKKNIAAYKNLSPGSEWMRRSAALIKFLQVRFLKNLLTQEELASYLSLTLTIGDATEMKVIFSMFQDKHSCNEAGDMPTSIKLMEEIGSLLESSSYPNLNKILMMETCRHLCCHETLSWLICTDCAKNMPTIWTKAWIALSKTPELMDSLKQLNQATIDQFRTWLKVLILKNPDDYRRLLKCMNTFLPTLIETWKKSNIFTEHTRRLLLDAADAIQDPKLVTDFTSIVNELFRVELEKLKPPAPVEQPRNNNTFRPPHGSQPQRMSVIPGHGGPSHSSGGSRGPHQGAPQTVPPVHHPAPQRQPEPPQKSHVQLKKEPPRAPSLKEPQKNVAKHVMSTDALFKRGSPTRKISPQKSDPSGANPPQKEQQPFSPPGRTKVCQNCKETISCAVFKCPKCHKGTRTVQPVTCPSCKQENTELRGYSCQFCYRSLLDVIYGGAEKSTEEPKPPPEVKGHKKKKKSVDKRKKAEAHVTPATVAMDTKVNPSISKDTAKVAMEITTITTVTEVEPAPRAPSKDERKMVQPIKLKVKNYHAASLTDSSDTDSMEDFVRRVQPPKKRRKQIPMETKVPPIIIKRKHSHPPPTTHSSLTDSSSEDDEKNSLVISSSEDLQIEQNQQRSKEFHQKMKISAKISSDRDDGEKLAKNKFSPKHMHQKSKYSPENEPKSLPKPQFYERGNPENTSLNRQWMKQTPKVTQGAQNMAPAVPVIKRGVGHSSMMTKKQKNILSRMKNLGKGRQKGSKTTPPGGPQSQEGMRSPPSGHSKRPSFENGPIGSPIRNSIDSLKTTERQRHDSSCSSGSIGSSPGLSFSLASIERSHSEKHRKKHRNVGHRTGGPPGSGKYEASRTLSFEDGPSNSETSLPRPLNHHKDGVKKKKKHKRRKELLKQTSFLEQKYDKLLAKRKPGPASKTGYRQILKIAHKLKKQRAAPHRRWRIPDHVRVPRHANLSRYAVVNLRPYPRHKLKRIQQLVNNFRLNDLYA